MCLAVPGKVIAILDAERQLASVEVAGVARRINLSLLPDDEQAGPGDWVLVHIGLALKRISEEEASETERVLRQITMELEATPG